MMRKFKNLCTYVGAFVLGLAISSTIKHIYLTLTN